MNSDHLHYLIELSKNSSINAASLKLHITPQALSTAIKKLEDELGFILINRSFKGISLTDDGEWLVKEASSFLDKIKQRSQVYQVKQSGIRQGSLEVAINYSGISNDILGQLICTLDQQEPNLKITLQEKSKGEILSTVQNNSSEIGFIFRTKLNGVYIDTLHEDLIFKPLFSGDLVLNVSSSSELSRFNTITMKKLVQYPLCGYNPQPETKDLTQHFISECFNFPVQYKHENNYSIYKEKIRRGMANSLSVFFPMEKYPKNYIEGTKMIHIRDDIKVYFGLVKKKNAVLTSNTIFFIQELKQMLHDLKAT